MGGSAPTGWCRTASTRNGPHSPEAVALCDGTLCSLLPHGRLAFQTSSFSTILRSAFTYLEPLRDCQFASRSTQSVSILHSERLIDAFWAEVSLCEIRLTKQPEEAHIRGQARSFWVCPKRSEGGVRSILFPVFHALGKRIGLSHTRGCV